MNSKLYKTIMLLLFIWLVYEIVHSSFLLLFFLSGLLFLFLYKSSSNNTTQKTKFLWISVGLFLATIVFTSAFWALLVIFLLVQLNSDQKLLETVRDPLFRKEHYWRDKEYVSVEWTDDDNHNQDLSLYRNKWFGDEFTGKEEAFEWEDRNYQKIMGDTFFDLGNTILPKKENVLIVRKGFGDTKILVPKEAAISLDVNLMLGKLVMDEKTFDLKNESVKWKSPNYNEAKRKIKIVSTTIIGEVEVFYL